MLLPKRGTGVQHFTVTQLNVQGGNTMYYEINVAKIEENSFNNGKIYRHYFATAPRSVTTEQEMKEMVVRFSNVFPAPEFNMTVTLWEKRGKGINISKLIKS